MLLKRCLIGAAFVLAVSCGAPPERPGPGTAAPAGARIPPAGLAVYRIDAAASELRILVYRDGPMARLGHDHVIQNRALAGFGVIDPGGKTFQVYLEIPVEEFLIDDPAARAAAGAGFEEEVSDAAKAGTRANLLGARLLDSSEYPVLRVDGRAVESDASGTAQATLEVHVAGHDATVAVPFTLEVGKEIVSVRAEFPLRQAALGLAPFSVMLGALQVRDEMHVRLTLVAHRT